MQPSPDTLAFPVMSSRSGFIAGGNFIVDTVLRIERFPQEEMLVKIVDESRGNGGGPYNVLCDLSAMQTGLPLAAICLLGDDENGRWIREDCVRRGIDVTQVHVTSAEPTAYTQVMTVQSTGRRTFFHRLGANRLLDVDHFDFSRSHARIFHLGYLLLLDRLDLVDEQGQTGAARVLRSAKEAGLTTSVDLVSVDHPSFRTIALAALPWTDYLIINEIEAGRILSRRLESHDSHALSMAAAELLSFGIGRSVVIHTEAGGFAATAQRTYCVGSLQLPRSFSCGANGAGDAFAAGFLYGVHENWEMRECLRLAVCAAAASLSTPTPSAGLRPVADCLALGEKYGHARFSTKQGK